MVGSVVQAFLLALQGQACPLVRQSLVSAIGQDRKLAAISTYGCSQWHRLALALSFEFSPLAVQHWSGMTRPVPTPMSDRFIPIMVYATWKT